MHKKEISVDIIYDKELKKITGKYAERLSIPSGSTSLDFVNLLLKKYPGIKKVPPARLGFERNNKIPKASQVLEDRDRYEFVIHDNDGGYGTTELGKLVDFVSEKMPRGELDGFSELDMKVLQTVADAGESGFLVPAGSDEKVMDWLDCVWKRISCGKDSCPICEKVKQDRKKLIKEGKDPDSIKSASDSLATNLAEAMALIKKDTEAMGIDISNLDDVVEAPSEKSFLLAIRAKKWYLDIMNLYKEADSRNATWLLTEEAHDLSWYAGTFNAKIYRQLCNKWYLDNEKDYGEFDYRYTSRVLKEVSKIINKSFLKLLPIMPNSRSLYKDFSLINKEAQKI